MFIRQRRIKGTTIPEAPLVLWIIIVGFMFPLLLLATIAFRFGLFWNACREATLTAARCSTFQVDPAVPVGSMSAVNTANAVANKAVNSFTGITVVPPINVYILSTALATSTTSKGAANTCLAAAADAVNNVYDVQVEMTGQIQPLVTLSSPVFGSIPGLSGPITVTVRSQSGVEIPQGLNK